MSIYIYVIPLSIGRKQVHPFFELLLILVGLPGVAFTLGWESCMFPPFWSEHVDSEACSIEEEFENHGFSDFFYFKFLNDEPFC